MLSPYLYYSCNLSGCQAIDQGDLPLDRTDIIKDIPKQVVVILCNVNHRD